MREREEERAPPGDEILLRPHVAVMRQMLGPPGVMPGKEHRQRGDGEHHAVGKCLFENQVVSCTRGPVGTGRR